MCHLAFSRLSLNGSFAYPPRETTRLSIVSKASMVCIDPSACLMVNTYGDGGDRVGASFRPKYSQMVVSLAMGTNGKVPSLNPEGLRIFQHILCGDRIL